MNVKLNEIFEMEVIQFLNYLTYLKEYQSFEKKLNARNTEF